MRGIFNEIVNKFLGPVVIDADWPDDRPVNPARDRMRVAQVMARANTKERVLEEMKKHIVAGTTDPTYEIAFHNMVVARCWTKAEELGAIGEEISAIWQRGREQGALEKSRLERF